MTKESLGLTAQIVWQSRPTFKERKKVMDELDTSPFWAIFTVLRTRWATVRTTVAPGIFLGRKLPQLD
jgi:hypothetical protein